MNSFDQLFETHVAASLDKQFRLPRLLGADAKGRFDLANGVMHFSGGHSFRAQLLGFESSHSGTWRWAWADESGLIPPPLIEIANKLRLSGKKHYVMEFTEPRFSLDIATGRQLSMIAAGVCKADCFFKVGREGRDLYMLLTAPPLRELDNVAPAHLRAVFKYVVANFDVDHLAALKAYLLFKGYAYRQDGPTLDAMSPDGRWLRAIFDDVGKLADLQTEDTSEAQLADAEEVYDGAVMMDDGGAAGAADALADLASTIESHQHSQQRRSAP